MEKMKFSETFEVITPESAENGDAEERGFNFSEVEYSFSDIVHYVKHEYIGAECSESRSNNPRWITSYEHDVDYQTGEVTNISLHPINERAKKYWPLILRAAGIIK